MTLTLDEVRKTRFHMSRRNGYEVTDVDLFVDKVEATLVQLGEESENLRRQLASGGDTSQTAVADLAAENDALRAQVQALQSATEGNDLAQDNAQANQRLSELSAALEQMRAEHEAVLAERDHLRDSNEALASQQGDAAVSLNDENDRLRSEIEDLRVRLSEATRAAASAGQGAVATPLTRMIVTTSAEASPAVVRLVQLATEQAEQLVNEAQGEAQRRLDAADQKAHDLASQARTQADRIESEARVSAERVTSEAQTRANSLEAEAASRQASMFAALEAERDQLVGLIEGLRGFEHSYRNNLTAHLQSQLKSIQGAALEPDDAPAGLPEPGSQSSATPRLDKLLSDQD